MADFYLYKGCQTEFEAIVRKKYLTHKKLNAPVLQNAYVLPAIGYRQAGQGFAKGGIVDNQGNYVPSSARYRDEKGTQQSCTMIGAYEFSKKDVPQISEPCIYCGEYLAHYGHFLCESMARLWYVVQHYKKGTKLVFISDAPRQITGNFREILRLLGVDLNDVMILTRVTLCHEIIVPDVSSVFGLWYTPEFILPFQKISDSVQKVYNKEKIYLSRTRFKDRFIIGEAKVEKLFEQNGYHVIYPEQIPLSELISYLKGAKIVAGLCGTGLHNIIFAHPNTRLIILNRANFANPAQELINQARAIQTTYVDVHFNYLGAVNSAFLIGLTPLLKKFAESMNFKKIESVPPLTKKEVQLYFVRCMKNLNREIIWHRDDMTLSDVWTAVLQSVHLPQNGHLFIKLKYLLLSKLCWGKRAKEYKRRYLNIVEK